jgi:protocatechuate 3,4-dioxygenase beta subunit
MPAKNPRVFPTLLAAAALALPLAVRAQGPETPVTACAEAAPEVLEGRVVDAAGRPIPGAEVWEVPEPHEAPPVSLAVSGADGRFVIRVDPARSVVEICHDGYLIEYLRRPLGTRPAEVVLHPTSRIAGRVLAPDGSPLPGAEVWAQDPRWVQSFSDLIYPNPPAPPPCPRSQPSRGTSTDAQGRFTLDPLWPGRYDVWAKATGYRESRASRHLDLGMGKDFADVEVRLEPGAVVPQGDPVAGPDVHAQPTALPSKPVAAAEVHGRVTTPQGDPVAEAEVSIANNAINTLTDARGAYRLTGVEPSTQEIWAVTEEDGIFTRSISHSIEVAPGENRLDLTLPPLGREVRGRVLAPDGTPVVGAVLHPEVGCPERAATRPHTADDGSFVIHLPAGTRRLMATLEGYSPGGIDVPGEKPIVGAVIRLTPDRGLSGRILAAEAGDLCAVGSVELYRVEESGQVRWCNDASVEPDGRYRLPGLWPGEWAVIAKVDGRILKGRVKLTPGTEAHLDLTLPPKLALHGRVVDEEGQPIGGAKVELERDDLGLKSGTSAADGTFLVRVESGGIWTAKAERAGFIPTSGEPVDVAAPTPRTIELVMARGAVLRVRVRGVPKGQVVQDLSASGESPPFGLEGEAVGEGIYTLSGLSPGKWTVQAYLGAPPLTELREQRLEKVSTQVMVGAKTRELTVDLAVPQGGLTLSGHLVDPMERVATIILKHLGEPDADFFAYPAPDEPFRFSGLAAGKYLLTVKGENSDVGYKVLEQEMELDASREIVLHLQRLGTLDVPVAQGLPR